MPPYCCSPAAAPPSSTPSPPSGRPRRSNPPRRRPSGQRAEPHPDRPVVELDLRLDDDLRTVTGTETVVFTPDLTTDELVFRLVPNGPGAAAAGNRLAAIDQLEERFGPFPYATLTVPLLPVEGGGIECPSSILPAGADRLVLFHEVAHTWLYGMVGDSQFRDPWLSEAFATYAESVASPVSGDAAARALRTPGEVGAAMDGFDSASDYFRLVYGKGGAALLAAGEAAGAAAFDAALRCYADANAWTIATPDVVAAALADLPTALDVLSEAGALDE